MSDNISDAFSRMEDDLIKRMIHSLQIGNATFDMNTGDINSWYFEQLRYINKFREENKAYFTEENTNGLFQKIEDALRSEFFKGADACKSGILAAVKKGFKLPDGISESSAKARFNGVNERKLKELIRETRDSLRTAAQSAVKYTETKYASILLDAKTYFESNSCTLATAIDTATRDFLYNGINCVQYKNGKCVNVQSYSEMVMRTANKRAYLQGEGKMRDAFGVHLVIVTRRGDACPRCMNYVGKVFVDDVYSSGKSDGKHPLLSSAIAGGLYHPNCRDSHTTYFEGITTKRPEPTKEERDECQRVYDLEQKQRYLERQVRGSDRLMNGACDEDNKKKYAERKAYYRKQLADLVASEPKLKRRYYRERNLIK